MKGLRYTIRDRGNSKEIRIEIALDPVTGKRRMKSFSIPGASDKEAHDAARARLAEIDGGGHIDTTKLVIRDYGRQWLQTARDKLAPASHRHYTTIVERHIIPALGNLIVSKTTSPDLAGFYSGLERRDGTEGDLSARTRRQIHAVLSQIMQAAIEDGITHHNPTAAYRRRQPKIIKRKPKVLTPKEQSQLIDAARGSSVFIPVAIACATGMRLGEILALRWSAVDLAGARLSVTGSMSYDTGEIGPTKTGEMRHVTLPAFIVEDLRHHRREQEEFMLGLGFGRDDERLVCHTVAATKSPSRSLSNAFVKLIGEMPEDFPRVNFHALRHSHATHLINLHFPVKLVSERLGHADVATTLRTYAHVFETMQEAAAAKIDEALTTLR